jgi:hypothetical protein
LLPPTRSWPRRKRLANTGCVPAARPDSLQHQGNIKEESRRSQGGVKEESRRSQGGVKEESKEYKGAY